MKLLVVAGLALCPILNAKDVDITLNGETLETKGILIGSVSYAPIRELSGRFGWSVETKSDGIHIKADSVDSDGRRVLPGLLKDQPGALDPETARDYLNKVRTSCEVIREQCKGISPDSWSGSLGEAYKGYFNAKMITADSVWLKSIDLARRTPNSLFAIYSAVDAHKECDEFLNLLNDVNDNDVGYVSSSSIRRMTEAQTESVKAAGKLRIHLMALMSWHQDRIVAPEY